MQLPDKPLLELSPHRHPMGIALDLYADKAVTGLIAERPKVVGRGGIGDQNHKLLTRRHPVQYLSRPEDRQGAFETFEVEHLRHRGSIVGYERPAMNQP